MPEKIDPAVAVRIAELARLDPSPEEIARMSGERSKIVEYVGKLNTINTDGIAPLHHVHDQHNVLADDIPAASLPVEEALHNAPERSGDFFKVPRVV